MAEHAPVTRSDTEAASTGQLVSRMSADLSDLVRSEVALAKVELQRSIRHAGIGAGLFGTAGVIALYGLGALVTAAVLALALVVDAWLAALIVAVALFAVAGVAALAGRRQVGEAAPPVQQSVESVKADVDAVKRPGSATPSHAAPQPEETTR